MTCTVSSGTLNSTVPYRKPYSLTYSLTRRRSQLVAVTVVLPDNDDEEVEYVPAVAQVGARVKYKPVRDYLDDRFRREDDYEHVLELLLSKPTPVTSSSVHKQRALALYVSSV